MPEGWRDRLVPIHNPNTGAGTGFCPEIHDLAVSKLVAGREKDLEFLSGILRHRLASVESIRSRLGDTALPPERLATCLHRLDRIIGTLR
jgi:hypothetical protein